MGAIGQRTLDVVNLYNSGVPIIEIAKKMEITPSSVEKRLRSYKKFKNGGWVHKSIQEPKWDIENIRLGFERFAKENGHLPAAYEIDDTPYLPSSRQIQRRFGGLGKLRGALGYGDILFSSGALRIEKQKIFRLRGMDAEDELEKILIKQFGQLFVHSEQRFAGTRNRVDFVVYAKERTIGIDVFTTDDRRTFIKNIAIKISKYTTFPADIPLFFVVWGGNLSQEQIDTIIDKNLAIKKLPSLSIVNPDTLSSYLAELEPLASPDGLKLL